MREAISQKIATVISSHCNCSVPEDFLKDGIFRCWNSRNEVTYRNTIITPANIKVAEYIEDWVKSEQPLEVDGFHVKVYKDCPVHIYSMSDPECVRTTELSTDKPSVIFSSNPGVIRCINHCFVGERGEELCQVP